MLIQVLRGQQHISMKKQQQLLVMRSHPLGKKNVAHTLSEVKGHSYRPQNKENNETLIEF